MTKVIFNNKNALFFQSLKESVDNYFREKGIPRTGNRRLYFKTLVLLLSALSLYILIVFFPLKVSLIILLGCFLGFIAACIGFNVMHDANHGSYSNNTRLNDILGLTLNALGGNSFIWKFKHNIIHHTYPNVDGVDDDIAKSPFIRMCSTQPWVPAHRFQHIYTPVLYALSSIIWVFFQDFDKYFRRKINNTVMTKMKPADHLVFWLSKVLYLLFYVVIPVAFMGWMKWFLFFISMHLALGFTLSIVFQLAHVVEDAIFEFASPDETTQVENEWAVYQVRSTCNFSPNSPLVSWLAGGLNYQVEHHLFPRISHIHYPALSRIVKEKCQLFDISYNCNSTLGKAIHSHFRLLRAMGNKPFSVAVA